MPVISDATAKQLAEGVKTIGGVQNYGGGSGGYSPHAPKYAPSLGSTSQPMASQNLITKISNIGKTVGNLATKGIAGVYHGLRDDVFKPVVRGAEFTLVNPIRQVPINIAQIKLDDKTKSLANDYRAGKITKDNYIKSLTDINKQQATYQRQIDGMSPYKNAGQALTDILENAATALTLGGGTVVKTVLGSGAKDVTGAFIAKGGKEAITQLTSLAGKRGGSAFVAAGGKQALDTMIKESANKVERTFLKVPAVKDVLTRNVTNIMKRDTQQLIGETTAQFITRESRAIAANLLIKRPLFYQMNIDSGQEIYQDMLAGNGGSAAKIAALQASQLVSGGLIGLFEKGGKWLRGGLSSMAYGHGSFIDEVSKATNNKIAEDLLKLKNTDPAAFANSEKVWRIFQEMNLRATNGDAKLAAQNFLANHVYAGQDLTQLTREALENEAQRHYDAQQVLKILQGKNIRGLDKTKLANAVVVRWDRFKKGQLRHTILEAGNDKQAITDALFNSDATANEAWNHNDTLKAHIMRIVDEGASAEDMAKRVGAIPTAVGHVEGIPASASKKLSDLGYVLATPTGGLRESAYVEYEDTRKLISGLTSGKVAALDAKASEVFDIATAPQPQVAALAGFLDKAGLSPRASQEEAYRALSNSVATSLEHLDVARGLGFAREGVAAAGGSVILSNLQRYVDNIQPSTLGRTASLTFGKARPAITDIRQLTRDEIVKAMDAGGAKISATEAKAIQKAVMQGYLDTPLQLRGFGDKVMDFMYKYNPAQKYYSRIQSALRYSYNPFFQTQEAVETSLFSGLQGGNKISSLIEHKFNWGKTKEELDSTIAQLEGARVFGGKAGGEGLLSSSLAGEGAQDQVLGRLTADITTGQKRDLAALALDMAKRQGTDVAGMLENNPEQLADGLRWIVQYPRKGGLASPLARTLNIVFFPMRYNAKVTLMAAQILSKQPPSVQFAVVHSLMNMSDWLQSDEGIKWRATNNDAIQVFNWISPLNNIAGVFNTLKYFEHGVTGQKTDGIAALGQLGGLPFGVISQVLDSLGIIDLNRPYVDPTKGNVIPDYIPQTTRAKAATAAVDLLGSLFTYPGRTLGLPGKNAALRGAVNAFSHTSQADYLKRTYQNPDGSLNDRGQQELSNGQKALVRVLGGDTSPEALDRLTITTTPNEFNWYTAPPPALPFNIPDKVEVLTRAQVAASKAQSKVTHVKPTAKPLGQF